MFKKYFKVIKYFAYILEILVFYTIQRVPKSLTCFLFNISPVYLIPITFTITIFEGKIAGLVFSIFIGILLDLESSYNLGFYTIVLGIFALLISLFLEKAIKVNFFMANALVLSSVVAICLLEFLFFFIYKGYKDAFYALTNFYLPRLGFTAMTIPLFYFFNKTVSSAPFVNNSQNVADESAE